MTWRDSALKFADQSRSNFLLMFNEGITPHCASTCASAIDEKKPMNKQHKHNCLILSVLDVLGWFKIDLSFLDEIADLIEEVFKQRKATIHFS